MSCSRPLFKLPRGCVPIPAAELMEQVNPNLHTAVLYTVAYLYEHREEADHRTLTLTLRSLLFGVRREGF